MDLYSRKRKDYQVKCFLRKPRTNATNDKIEFDNRQDIIIFCKDMGFSTSYIQDGNRRIKRTDGTLETVDLLKDEIAPDWQIVYDDEIYIINDIEVKTKNVQKGLLKRVETITTFKVRK